MRKSPSRVIACLHLFDHKELSLTINQNGTARWKGAVSFTFDDGWRSVYENAFPILEAAGVRATHYIVSGYSPTD